MCTGLNVKLLIVRLRNVRVYIYIYVGNIYAYVSKAGGPHLKATQEYPGQLGLLASGIEIHSCAVMPIYIYIEARILYLIWLKAPHRFHFQPCRPNRSQVGKLVRDQIRQFDAKEPLDDSELVFHDSGSESDDSGLGELIH